VGVGNFGKIGVAVGYFTSDSATLAETYEIISTRLIFAPTSCEPFTSNLKSANIGKTIEGNVCI